MNTMASETLSAMTGYDEIARLARQLRVDSIRASTSAGSGHPSSSMSAADLMAVLLTRHLRYDWSDPTRRTNDRFVLSKGHASPLLYSAFKAVGVITDSELMSGYRRLGSRLQGHPTPVLPWVEVATGSLGQGLPDGVGIALAGRYLDREPYRVWVLCGDGEMAEGSMWEALAKASHFGLSNLITIIDVNRLGQTGPTDLGWDVKRYAQRAEAFGARVLTIDGHDLHAIDEAMRIAGAGGGDAPLVIVAKTVKGKGFPQIEDELGWHGKPLPPDMAEAAIEMLGGESSIRVTSPLPPDDGATARRPERFGPGDGEPAATADGTAEEELRYELGEKVATRRAYGDALVRAGHRHPQVVALDGEVGNSTYAQDFGEAFPQRFFEMFIAEQQMVAAATGLATRGYMPFASTFGAFLTRAHDFVRVAAISNVSMALVGSHCGVEIGADGPSQMALEDLAMMRAVPGSTVLYPSDAPCTAALVEKMVEKMADHEGIGYLRTTRGAYPVLYGPDEEFEIGGSKLLRSSPNDDVTLLGAGVTVHECLEAAESLAGEGISARVLDCYSIQPIDAEAIARAVFETGGRVVVVEDHHPAGGLGEAVLEALVVNRALAPDMRHLAVRGVPGSGSSAELLEWAGIDAASIVLAARESVNSAHESEDLIG